MNRAEKTSTSPGEPALGEYPPGVLQRPKRKTGKHPGWITLKNAHDAQLALQRVLNLLLVGNTKAEVPPGTPPTKIDSQTANAAANVIRTWLTANGVTMEERLEEIAKTNEMLLELLRDRGIDVSGGGSRNQ